MALAAVGLAGCVGVGAPPRVAVPASHFQAASSGSVGCPPGEIAISGQQASYAAGDPPATWRAECRGRRYFCTGAQGTVSCTEDRPAAPGP